MSTFFLPVRYKSLKFKFNNFYNFFVSLVNKTQAFL